MGFPIKVKTNIKEVSSWLRSIHSKQIPFSTSVALNNTAFDVRKQLVEKTYQKAFKLRNSKLPSYATRVKKATKNKLIAVVGNISGRELDFLVTQAEGGIKTPKGRSLAIPSNNTKRNSKGAVPKAQRPRQLMAKGKSFITSVNGTRVIMEQKSKKKAPVVKYILTPSAKIDKALQFFEDGNKVVDRVFKRHFVQAFSRAIKTAR